MPSERIQRRIDRLLDQIEESADQEEWETTLRLSEQVLDLDPDDEDAHTFLRLAELRQPADQGRRVTIFQPGRQRPGQVRAVPRNFISKRLNSLAAMEIILPDFPPTGRLGFFVCLDERRRCGSVPEFAGIGRDGGVRIFAGRSRQHLYRGHGEIAS